MSITCNTVLDSGTWGFPIPIHYGPGSSRHLGRIARENGMIRPLIVSDSETAKLPFLNMITDLLKSDGLEPQMYSSFSPNPTDVECIAGGEIFRTEKCDSVIAIGGGSSMDTGKAIALSALGSHEDIWVFDGFAEPMSIKDAGPFAPLICVPTTSGTGAEVEPAAMVTNTTTHEKRGFLHPSYRPLAAVLDPELTIGLPPNLTAWTGIDAMVHAIEAYLVPAFHPMCDGIALQALSLMAPVIKRAYHDGSDMEARSAMMVGSCLAAVSFAKGLGIVHAVSHMVGGLYNTQHGLTNAVILPAAMRYNRPEILDKSVELARVCGADHHDFDGLLGWIHDLHEELGIPHSLGELGVEHDDVNQLVDMVQRDVCFATNPRSLNPEELGAFISGSIDNTW
jgi:alcohol dehydrogenase class IV